KPGFNLVPWNMFSPLSPPLSINPLGMSDKLIASGQHQPEQEQSNQSALPATFPARLRNRRSAKRSRNVDAQGIQRLSRGLCPGSGFRRQLNAAPIQKHLFEGGSALRTIFRLIGKRFIDRQGEEWSSVRLERVHRQKRKRRLFLWIT